MDPLPHVPVDIEQSEIVRLQLADGPRPFGERVASIPSVLAQQFFGRAIKTRRCRARSRRELPLRVRRQPITCAFEMTLRKLHAFLDLIDTWVNPLVLGNSLLATEPVAVLGCFEPRDSHLWGVLIRAGLSH